jgi:Ca2+-binding RTX toxin-like protein
VLLVLALVAGLSSFSAWGLTSANLVPASRADDLAKARDVNEMKPAECNGITLTNVVVGTNGTNQNDLVLGGPAGQTMRGQQGNDCVLGGGGDDTFRDNGGYDVCIGGPGNDLNGLFGLLQRCDVFYQ